MKTKAKGKVLITVTVVVCLIMAMLLTACGGSSDDGSGSESITLESYIQENPSESEALESLEATDGMEISVKENDVILNYDLGSIDNMNKEIAASDEIKEALSDSLDEQAETFQKQCAELEEETGVEGIKIVVNYTFEDETVLSKEFTAD